MFSNESNSQNSPHPFSHHTCKCLEVLLRLGSLSLLLSLGARGVVKGPQFIHTGNLGVISPKDEQIKATLPMRGHFIKPSYPRSGHKQTKSQLFSISTFWNIPPDWKKMSQSAKENQPACVWAAMCNLVKTNLICSHVLSESVSRKYKHRFLLSGER